MRSKGRALVLGTGLCLAGVWAVEVVQAADWYSRAWSHRQKVTVDSSMVAGTQQTNFPVFVKLTAAGNSLFSTAQADGGDILFTASDGTTRLAHELETYDASAPQLLAWVKIPLLPSATDTEIYMYYGHANVADQQDPATVWDDGYEGVWHLAQNPTNAGPQMTESTAGQDGTCQGGMTNDDLIAAQVGYGLDFDGTDDYVSLPNLGLDLTTVTLSAWIRPDSFVAAGAQFGKGIIGNDANGWAWYGLTVGGGYSPEEQTLVWTVRNGGGATEFSVDTNELFFTAGQWYHVCSVDDNSTVKLYVNGVLRHEAAMPGKPPAQPYYRIGDFNNGSVNFDGGIDEVRISTVARSADWLLTSYRNMNDPGSYLTFSGAEQRSAATAGWYDNSWQHRQEIVIWREMVAAGTQTNFPALVKVTDASNPLFQHAQSSGGDLLFTAADGVTKLAHEIETYASNTTQLAAWVRLPLLPAAQDTSLFMYYGNPLAPDQQDAATVWSEGYRAVWHLAENPTNSAPQVVESTSNGDDGTCQGGMTNDDLVAAQAGYGLDFDGTDDYVSLPNMALGLSTLTLSAWVRPDGFAPAWDHYGKGIVGTDDNAWSWYGIMIGGGWQQYTQALVLAVRSGSNEKYWYTTNTVSLTGWSHVCAVDDASTVKLYVDGVLELESAAPTNKPGSHNYYRIGDMNKASTPFDGTLDEVRVSTVVRSSNWVATCYSNLRDPGSYVVPGREERLVPVGTCIILK